MRVRLQKKKVWSWKGREPNDGGTSAFKGKANQEGTAEGTKIE